MSELRADGRPFVLDTRGAVPRYVVEEEECGRQVLRNQFTCSFETIHGSRPFTREALVDAYRRLETGKDG